ncbi:MAG: pyridoxamine kinase [Christensenellales bacterium]|jgi:pyridoxine kinase
MREQKRVAAIHDISGFGKCSITVALPIISAAGIETSVIPTAVLSTHTGGIDGFTYRDLTDDILPIAEHWKALELGFDAIYTGFLGSFRQLDIVAEICEMLKDDDTLIVVDPVMADFGELYKVFPKNFPDGMKKLCAKADVMVPNMTEAALLLGREYHKGPYEKTYIEDMLRALSRLGPDKVVLTGVYFDNDKLGAAAFDKNTDSVEYMLSRRIEGQYHGTGDVFGSALLSALMSGKSLSDAAGIAVEFTVRSIERTRKAGTDVRFGVNFESELPYLIRSLGLC